MPQTKKSLIEVRNDTFHERAITDPIFDQNHQRFLSKAGSVFGGEFFFCSRVSRHSDTPTVRSQGPGITLN